MLAQFITLSAKSLSFVQQAQNGFQEGKTNHHKEIKFWVCTKLKQCYTQQDDAFMDRIIMCDKTVMHHFEQTLKRESMEWKHTSYLPRQSSELNNQQEKSCWWSFGILKPSMWFLDQCTILWHAYWYSKASMEVAWILHKRVIFLHDNANSLTAQLTQEINYKLDWKTLPHTIYNPDLAPNDFHLSGPLKVLQSFMTMMKQKNVLNWLWPNIKIFL